MTVEQLRTKLVEAALFWQVAKDNHVRGTGEAIMVTVAERELARITRLYRAATR